MTVAIVFFATGVCVNGAGMACSYIYTLCCVRLLLPNERLQYLCGHRWIQHAYIPEVDSVAKVWKSIQIRKERVLTR